MKVTIKWLTTIEKVNYQNGKGKIEKACRSEFYMSKKRNRFHAFEIMLYLVGDIDH